MERMNCHKYISCSAPICPLDEESIKNSLWFVNEEICVKSDVPLWVKIQRRIARKMKGMDHFAVGYFKVKMLESNPKVSTRLKGIILGRGQSSKRIEVENAWLEKHKSREKKQLTEEQRTILVERMKNAREKKKMNSCLNGRSRM